MFITPRCVFAVTLGFAITTSLSAAPLDDARADFDAGKLPEARIQLMNVLQQDPSNAIARLLFAETLLRLGNGAFAEQEIRRALSDGLERKQALVPLAEALLLQGKPLVLLDEIQVPDDAPPAMQAALLAIRGDAYNLLENHELAKQELERSLQLENNNPRATLGMARVAFATNDLKQARQLTDAVLQADPESAAAWEMLGEIDSRHGDTAKAEHAFSKSLGSDPLRWSAFYQRAMARLDQNNLDGAEQDLEELGKLNKEFGGNFLVRGRLLLAREEIVPATQALEQYALLIPKDPQGHFLASQAFFLADRAEAALQYLDKYLSLAPETYASALPAAQLLLMNGEATRAEALITPYTGQQNAGADEVLVFILELQQRLPEALTVMKRLLSDSPDNPIYLRVMIRLLALTGAWTEVLDTSRKLLELEPGSLSDRLTLINSLIRTDHIAEARAEANALVEQFPDEADAHLALGSALLAAREVPEAKAAFARAQDMGLNKAAVTLARVEQATGNGTAARQRLEQLLARDPDHIQATLELARLELSSGDKDAGYQRLEAALTRHPDTLAYILPLARAYLRENRIQDGLRVVNNTKEPAASDIRLLTLLAQLESAAGRPNNAIRTCERMVEKYPNSAQAHLLLAIGYANVNNVTAAEKQILEGLRLNPDISLVKQAFQAVLPVLPDASTREALFAEIDDDLRDNPVIASVRASVALRNGDYDAALKTFGELHRANPEDRDLLRSLLAAQVKARRSREATRTANEWLGTHPDDADVREQLGHVYLQRGQTDNAIKAYRQVLTTNPDRLMTLNNLAELLQSDAPAEALQLAEHAHALEPENPYSADTLGMILLENGQAERARSLLELAYRKQPGNASVGFRYARTLATAGDKEAARRILATILQQSFEEKEEATALLRQLSSE